MSGHQRAGCEDGHRGEAQLAFVLPQCRRGTAVLRLERLLIGWGLRLQGGLRGSWRPQLSRVWLAVSPCERQHGGADEAYESACGGEHSLRVAFRVHSHGLEVRCTGGESPSPLTATQQPLHELRRHDRGRDHLPAWLQLPERNSGVMECPSSARAERGDYFVWSAQHRRRGHRLRGQHPPHLWRMEKVSSRRRRCMQKTGGRRVCCRTLAVQVWPHAQARLHGPSREAQRRLQRRHPPGASEGARRPWPMISEARW